MKESRQPEHFERLYRSSPDPWAYRTSAYEKEKYHHTLGVLASRRFASGLEVGCSIGELTHLLAKRCDALLGIDFISQALAAAAARCEDHPNVRFARKRVPREWPSGHFDLIVLSEILYFLSPSDIDYLVRRVVASIIPNGIVLLVNWLGQGDDPLTGDDAATRFIRASVDRLVIVYQARHPGYRLDVLEALP